MQYKVDASRGQNVDRVNAEWAKRADDERFLDLDSLYRHTKLAADESHADTFAPVDFGIQVQDEQLRIALGDVAVAPTHHSFGRLCNMAKVPASYLRQPDVPPALAAACLRNGLVRGDQDVVQAYIRDGSLSHLRALTSPSYGRIYDHEVVAAVQKVAGNGTGDTRWKVPGVLDWGTMTYHTEQTITKQNTTLYASDRDVFLFLVDDRNPIEVGTLRDGSPDMMFRGFYVWNSEVGERTFGVATMYLRAVCMNRNLWGVEDFNEVTIRHTAGAPDRFVESVLPALEAYAEGNTTKVVQGVKAAKLLTVASDDDERIDFLGRFDIGRNVARDMIAVAELEEERKPESAWDMAQAVTAYSRRIVHQDDRTTMEKVSGKILDLAAA